MIEKIPYLSIVIPAYNESQNLCELVPVLTGVLLKTGKEYEVILIDDGSTDNTVQVCREMMRADAHLVLVEIAAVTLFICAINFTLGRLIGGRAYGAEASQSLGQKNTSFTLLLALTYANPLVALGPTCYILWHNLWNSWQLHRVHRHAAHPIK